MDDLTIADEHVDTSSDDTIVELTEEQEEAQLDADFEEDDGAETIVDDDTVDDGSETKTPEQIEEAQKVDDAADETKTPEEIQDETDAAQKVIDDAKIAGDAKKVEPVKKVEPAPELTSDQKEAAQKQADATKAQTRDDFLTDMADKMKDIVIGDGGEEGCEMPKNMAEFSEQFPEIANSMKEFAAFTYDKIMGELNPLRDSISENQAKARDDALISELSSEDFGHADVSDIIASTEFQDWVANQTPAFQSYVDSAGTAQDVAAVLSRYKTEAGIEAPKVKADTAATEKATKVADEQRKTKTEKDNLGKASGRNKKLITKKGDGESEDDLDAIFDEDDE